MHRHTGRLLQGILALGVGGGGAAAHAGVIYHFSDNQFPGLSAEVEFTLINATTLQVRARNTSAGAPGGFDSADQILTSVSWDFGDAGAERSDQSIVTGTATVGGGSQSKNFDHQNVGAGGDVSGEYGAGNEGTTGLLPNFVSTNAAGATRFPGENLDGPKKLNGPQGGMVANPEAIPLAGLGAVQDEVIFNLTLDAPLNDLDFLADHGVIVEFGSDAAFISGIVIPVPPAAILGLVGVGMVGWIRRRIAA